MKTHITLVAAAILMGSCGENKNSNGGNAPAELPIFETYSDWKKSEEPNIAILMIPNFTNKGKEIRLNIIMNEPEYGSIDVSLDEEDFLLASIDYLAAEGQPTMDNTTVSVADLNADGLKDIRIDYPIENFLMKTIYVLQNKDGKYSFFAFNTYKTASDNEVDIDGDGKYEFVVRSLEQDTSQNKSYWVDNVYALMHFGLENANQKGDYPRVFDSETEQEISLIDLNWVKKYPKGYDAVIFHKGTKYNLPPRKGFPDVRNQPNEDSNLPINSYYTQTDVLYEKATTDSKKIPLHPTDYTFLIALRAVTGEDGKLWYLCYAPNEDLTVWTTDLSFESYPFADRVLADVYLQYGANPLESYRLLGFPELEIITFRYTADDVTEDDQNEQSYITTHFMEYKDMELDYTLGGLMSINLHKKGAGFGGFICGKQTRQEVIALLKANNTPYEEEDNTIIVTFDVRSIYFSFDKEEILSELSYQFQNLMN